MINKILEFLKLYGFEIVNNELTYYQLTNKKELIGIYDQENILIYTENNVYIIYKYEKSEFELFKKEIVNRYPIKTRKNKYKKLFT